MGRINWRRLFLGGLVAGLVINAVEFVIHVVFLGEEWRAAFTALNKNPGGWASFLPQNFLVGGLAVWLYAPYVRATAWDRRLLFARDSPYGPSLISLGIWHICR